jgi:hypothetical protein
MDFVAKVGFAVISYLYLLVVAVASCGLGHFCFGRKIANQGLSKPLYLILNISCGIGFSIVFFFVIGLLGVFLVPVVLIFLSACFFYGMKILFSIFNQNYNQKNLIREKLSKIRENWFCFALIGLIIFPYILSPLQPPFKWDELMYHLPHAKLWAETGRITVNSHIRFPLFPYNFDLLYAACLLFQNDVLTHLVHAFAGWLVVAGLLFGSTLFFQKEVAFLAAFIFFWVTKAEFNCAYIDLGLALFVFFSFLCLAIWYEKKDTIFLYLSAFFIAMAIGTKYQGLLYLPFFGFFVLANERRPKVLITIFLIIFLFGSCWYFRSFIVSGDPIHPFGGKYFGYWLWDEEDIRYQIDDIKKYGHFIPKSITPALFAILFLRRSSVIYKGLFFIGYGSLAIWLFSSRYDRYLLPAYPFLALLSSYSLFRLTDIFKLKKACKWVNYKVKKWQVNIGKILLILIIAYNPLKEVKHIWNYRVFVTDISKMAYLQKTFPAYEFSKFIENDSNYKLYQLGFEDSIYYLPKYTVGDWFGPGRYREVFALAQNASELADYLKNLNINALLINKNREPFRSIQFDYDFQDFFDLVMKTERGELYKLKDR